MGVRFGVQMTVGFDAVVERVLKGLDRGTHLAGERLLALSAEVAPLDVGTLIGSGAVTDENSPGGESTAVVSYDTPYAARLHEHPEYNFQGGRQGKFLEGPAVENRKELGDIIRKEVRGG